MLRVTTVALAAAIIAGSALAAAAATRQHPGKAARVRQAAPPSTIITNQCLPTDNPCRTKPDGW